MVNGYLYCSMNTHTTFDQKVAEGCEWYVKKYGRMPDVCIVNPADVGKLTITNRDKIYVAGKEITVMSWERMVKEFIGLCMQAPSPVDLFIEHAKRAKVKA